MSDRARSWRAEDGQATVPVLIAAVMIVAFALALAVIAIGISLHGQRRTAADLAALAAARTMRDAQSRMFAPVDSGRHLKQSEYLELARDTARKTVARNGGGTASVSFPEQDSFTPTRVRVRVSAPITVAGRSIEIAAAAEAEMSMTFSDIGDGATLSGQYSGPLAERQGKRMRPDVAKAFDRMNAAARSDGVTLIITSAFRSDAEQAKLFEAHPDPKWVAPPGKSLHRLGTELDLGPAAAYGWLAANAPRFGFKKRYSWEPWHFGYIRAAGSRSVGFGPAEGRPAMGTFVPERYAPMIARAAQRWNVGAALLAAQIYKESNFNPLAVSTKGAGGIAQFLVGTGEAYGLSEADRFDPEKAIMAQAHYMHDMLRQFGSVPLALAAYNVGPGRVQACGCIPFRDTQNYVISILALLAGVGDGVAGTGLEVRLVS